MIKKLAIFVFIFTFYPFSFIISKPYNFGHIDYSQGLSNNRVLCFAEDNNGFMWIGTSSGLNRYDGYDIKEFMHNSSDSASIPDNMVQSIIKDQFGRLWINTPNGITIFNPDTELFNNNKLFLVKNEVFDLAKINMVVCAGDSNLALKTGSNHIILHNIYTKKNQLLKSFTNNTITTFKISGKLLYAIENSGIITVVDINKDIIIRKINTLPTYFKHTEYDFNLFVDDNKKLWIYSNDGDFGILIIDKNDKIIHLNTLSSPALNSNIISSVIQNEDKDFWIGTDHGGINIINADLNKISYVKHEESNKNSLSQNVITQLFKSKSGIIWIGTFKQGVNYYHKSLFRFSHYNHQLNKKNSLSYNDVNCFAEDKKGNLWIGTNGHGLIYFDRKKNIFTKIPSKLNQKDGLKSNVIVSLFIDKKQNIWIGTYHGGLSVFNGENFKSYINNPNNPKSISDNRVWDIFEDSRGNLWIGLLGGGLDLFDRKQQIFRHYSGTGLNSIASNFVMDITEDRNKNIWFATDNGVFVLEHDNTRFKQFSQQINNKHSLSNNFVSTVFIDSKNNTWIGTRDGLNLFAKKSKTFIKFTKQNGLPNNTIMGIQESNEGKLWVSTTEGLCELTIEYNAEGEYLNHHTVVFNESDGLQGREFNEGSSYKTSIGELIFGGSNGFNLFKPESEKTKPLLFGTKITGLEIFGKEIKVNSNENQNSVIQNSLLNNETIELSFKQNIFSLKFVAIDYLEPKKISYRYKLEGFNSQWIYASWEDRKATFTNLNPGKYTFKVQSTDYNTKWNESESLLYIIIKPPWYRTWLAYAIYFLLIVTIAIILRRIIILKERNKFNQEQRVKEAKRQQELNVLKTRFFTNVSHEFRTPLTLILTPLEKLIKSLPDNEAQKHLVLMQQNAKRLLNLVNQLLDFRKIEENKLKVNYIYGNVIGFLQYVCDSFTDFRDSKNIELDFLPDEKELFMQFDKDKLEKIIFNLLSNAFKFTPEKGYIRVFIETISSGENEELIIVVKDSGIGIKEEQQAKIFERFYQSDLPNNYITKGSGIGLSLTQDFVSLLKGKITVKSKPGKGSQFIVNLPINREIPKHLAEEINWAKETISEPIKNSFINNEPLKDSKTIMLVEDNADFRYYLKDSLQGKFNIIECENGKIALEYLNSKQPDLIVSDVMMPEIDGLELCNEIKTNATFSHIPVILLTAKSTQQDKLEGLKQGADEYISKPFSLDILESRIDYLLAQRQKFIKHYQKSFKVESENNCITPLDEKLLNKAHELINENISNSEYSVEKLSKDLGMSRVYLYKKLSSLTGKTPVELIRLIRLKKAAQLLLNSNFTISEVAYEVGFTDPRYFSKQFKNVFDVLPSKFKENQG